MNDKLILGENVVFSTDTNETHLNNNVCLVGCTGSGKTLFFIQSQLIYSYDTNFIIYDPKRELVGKYRDVLKKRKYNTYELNLSDPIKSDVKYDFILNLTSHTEVSDLAKAIVNLTPQSEYSHADRYWADSSCNLAEFGIYYILATKENATMNDFLEFINDISIEENNILMQTSVDHIVDSIKKKNPNHPMVAPYNSFKTAPIKTAGCIFSDLKTTLSNVFNEDVKEMLKTKKQFDINEFVNHKSILFITSDGKNEYTNSLVNLIFERIICELTKIADKQPEMRLPIPTRLILDDFACGTTLRSFPREISKFRSKAICSTIVLQSLSQLEAMYSRADATTIINNNDTLVYLGGNDLQTCKDFAERLNQPLEKVLNMPIDKIAIFRRGSEPIITRRYPILDDKNFQKISKNYVAIKKKQDENRKVDNHELNFKNEIRTDDTGEKDISSRLDELFEMFES